MFKKIFMFILIGSAVFAQDLDRHGDFTSLLKEVVKDGWVNYKALKSNDRLDNYVKRISAVDPDTIKSKYYQLAFWINAYNAFTLKVITDNYPIESINELHTGGRIIGHILKKTVWDKKLFTINGKEISLNDIEHGIIRKKFKEPRIHFALVCASISCPPLREEAYEGYKVNSQLADQARRFLSSYGRNYFELTKRKAYLSKIFDWYGDDFAPDDHQILLRISEYLKDDIREDIQNNLDKWEIEFLPYDWNLNELKN